MTEHATFEMRYEETRSGIIIELDAGRISKRRALDVLRRTFEFAGEESIRSLSDPGWWAIMVGRAATDFGPARVQRVARRSGTLHAVVRVERGRYAEQWPEWPMARFEVPDVTPWQDLRGPAALRHGPSLAEMQRFAYEWGLTGAASDPASVMRMFEHGVIEWEEGRLSGGRRRRLRRATPNN